VGDPPSMDRAGGDLIPKGASEETQEEFKKLWEERKEGALTDAQWKVRVKALLNEAQQRGEGGRIILELLNGSAPK
jgi:hypothetical protein